MTRLSHIAVDWGTSSFRLWALDRDGRTLAERRSAQGLTVAAVEGFEKVLESHLAALSVPDGVPVMMCGMVGARGGWAEAAYVDVPTRLDALAARATHISSARRPVRVLPGLAQRDPAQPDVMRGEETQLIGLAQAGFEGLACLPGTHSKWVTVADGEVTGFATFMTGELFQMLRGTSVIAPAVAGAAEVDAAGGAFCRGVSEGLALPEALGNALFRLRASWLLADTAPASSLGRLSGLLIGAELAGAAQRFGSLSRIALIASEPLASAYRTALAGAGASLALHDADECVRAGLHAAALAAFRQERSPA